MSDADAWGASKRLCRVDRPHPPLPGSAVEPLSQFSAVLNNHVTGTALLCRTVCEGPSPFGRKETAGLTFTGQTDRLRDVRPLCVRVLTKTDKHPSQRARTADGGARYIVRATVVHWHRSTALECGLWCAWFCLFTHHFSGGEPVSATRTFLGICGVQL